MVLHKSALAQLPLPHVGPLHGPDYPSGTSEGPGPLSRPESALGKKQLRAPEGPTNRSSLHKEGPSHLATALRCREVR